MIYDRHGRISPPDPTPHEPEIEISSNFNVTGQNHTQTLGAAISIGEQTYGVGSEVELTFGTPNKTGYEYFDVGDDVQQLVEDWEVKVILKITLTEGMSTTTSYVHIDTMDFALVDVGEI